MLSSQFSEIFPKFRRGKNAFFLKTNVTFQFLKKTRSILNSNCDFFAKLFGETIFYAKHNIAPWPQLNQATIFCTLFIHNREKVKMAEIRVCQVPRRWQKRAICRLPSQLIKTWKIVSASNSLGTIGPFCLQSPPFAEVGCCWIGIAGNCYLKWLQSKWPDGIFSYKISTWVYFGGPRNGKYWYFYFHLKNLMVVWYVIVG
jgi:hypothetical protein